MSRVHNVLVFRVLVVFFGDGMKINILKKIESVHGFDSVGCVFGFFVDLWRYVVWG